MFRYRIAFGKRSNMLLPKEFTLQEWEIVETGMEACSVYERTGVRIVIH